MELWIRTQDKECLMKVDRIDYDYSAHTHRIMANGYETLIGLYETKERALEVLDEIQNKIDLINLGHDFGSPMIDLKNPTYIYQMPTE